MLHHNLLKKKKDNMLFVPIGSCAAYLSYSFLSWAYGALSTTHLMYLFVEALIFFASHEVVSQSDSIREGPPQKTSSFVRKQELYAFIRTKER
jgi:hypothetical protein